ncbi:hypothetical protein FRC14_000239 [Serendipita sp. 396]|nr:hypothetical protein FRC14_000239 [Serendipita sp. 396]KAG8786871.1 hypothetical protein FRC15_010523 [Serendipita sp. 397]
MNYLRSINGQSQDPNSSGSSDRGGRKASASKQSSHSQGRNTDTRHSGHTPILQATVTQSSPIGHHSPHTHSSSIIDVGQGHGRQSPQHQHHGHRSVESDPFQGTRMVGKSQSYSVQGSGSSQTKQVLQAHSAPHSEQTMKGQQGPHYDQIMQEQPPLHYEQIMQFQSAPSIVLASAPEPPTTRKIKTLYNDLKGLRQTMKEEIHRLKDIQSATTLQEKILKEKRESTVFYEAQIKRLKKERDELSLMSLSVPDSSAMDLLKEEHEQDKRRIDEKISRWEELLSKSKKEVTTLDREMKSNISELGATREAIEAHDAMRKRLISALDTIERTSPKRRESTESLEALLARIESSLPQLTSKEREDFDRPHMQGLQEYHEQYHEQYHRHHHEQSQTRMDKSRQRSDSIQENAAHSSEA